MIGSKFWAWKHEKISSTWWNISTNTSPFHCEIDRKINFISFGCLTDVFNSVNISNHGSQVLSSALFARKLSRRSFLMIRDISPTSLSPILFSMLIFHIRLHHRRSRTTFMWQSAEPSAVWLIASHPLTICCWLFGFLIRSGILKLVTASIISASSNPSRASIDKSVTLRFDLCRSR